MEIINREFSNIKLFKKVFDNSFYPATYNIEKNCVEVKYPNTSNIFYFTNAKQYDAALKASRPKLEVTIKNKDKTKKFLLDLLED